MHRIGRIAALTVLVLAAFPALAGASTIATEADSADTCSQLAVQEGGGPASVRCDATVERPGNGAFVSGSAGATVRDGDTTVLSFDQPIGRTGAAFQTAGEPATTQTQNATILPPNVVCAPFVGCTGAVEGPVAAEVRLLPGGSALTLATVGGGGTVHMGETCVNSSGCDQEGPARIGRVTFTEAE